MSPRLMICMFVFVWRMPVLGLITSYHSVPSRRMLPSQVLSLSLPSPPQRSHSRVTFQRGSSPCIPMSLSSSTPLETPLRSSPGLDGVNFWEQFLEFRHDRLIINSSDKAPSIVVVVVVVVIIIIVAAAAFLVFFHLVIILHFLKSCVLLLLTGLERAPPE